MQNTASLISRLHSTGTGSSRAVCSISVLVAGCVGIPRQILLVTVDRHPGSGRWQSASTDDNSDVLHFSF